jgi:hypothetical protein
MLRNDGQTSIIILSGGLGNQLFQLMTALTMSENHKLRVFVGLLEEKNSISKIINEILIQFPQKKIEIIDSKKVKLGFLQVKINNFALRLSSQVHCRKRTATTLNIIIKCCIRVVFPGFSHYIVPSEIGRSSSAPRNLKNSLFIGYFQSLFWVSESLPIVIEVLDSLDRKSCSTTVQRKPTSKDLLVHIRGGDYDLEEKIGVLSSSYFNFAIQTAWNSEPFASIRLFSNSKGNLAAYWPQELNKFIIDMEDETCTSLDILLMMRKCGAAVISNSTLSWWAAP